MAQTLSDTIAEVRSLLKDREGVGGDLQSALKKVRRKLPRRIYRLSMELAQAAPLLQHPKLQMTLDQVALQKAGREVVAHLKSIDLADRRKGRILDVLASISFALIVVAVLLLVVLRWRGFV